MARPRFLLISTIGIALGGISACHALDRKTSADNRVGVDGRDARELPQFLPSVSALAL
jgi:hypothetical protein